MGKVKQVGTVKSLGRAINRVNIDWASMPHVTKRGTRYQSAQVLFQIDPSPLCSPFREFKSDLESNASFSFLNLIFLIMVS